MYFLLYLMGLRLTSYHLMVCDDEAGDGLAYPHVIYILFIDYILIYIADLTLW